MRTEFRPASFQILPTVIKNLLIINALVYLAQLTVDGIDPYQWLTKLNHPMTDLI